MKVTIRIMQHGHKVRLVVVEPATVTMEQARRLWEAEQVLNSIGNLRVHIGMTEEE